MITAENIQFELKQITHELTQAAEQINSGITLDLSHIGPRAQVLCEKILQLQPEESIQLLTEMHDAVSQLNQLSEQIKGSE
jgi:hypothetical protein